MFFLYRQNSIHEVWMLAQTLIKIKVNSEDSRDKDLTSLHEAIR